MRGLLSNFGDQLLWVLVIGLSTLAAVGVAVARSDRAVRARSVSRLLAGGSALVVVVATAVGPVSQGGDLVLRPGGAGLGDLDQVLADPTSLAAVLLVTNVVLYVPMTFFGLLGWPSHPRLVLAAAVALSLSIETAQLLFLGRVASTDDVLLNVLGAAIGYVAATLVLRSRSAH